MKPGNLKKVAVIGGGVAGLGAAWPLSKRYDVTLYDRNEYLGGHACTLEYKGELFDIGFLIHDHWGYGSLCALMQRFGLKSEVLPGHDFSYSVRFDGGMFSSLVRTEFGDRIADECFRFESAIPDIIFDPVRYSTIPLRDYLRSEGYSDDFLYKCLIPVTSILFVTRSDIANVSTFRVAFNFGPIRMASFYAKIPWRTICSKEYVDAIVSDMPRARIRKGTAVEAVKRFPDRVEIRTADGATETFDAVVMAAHADQSLTMLSDPSPLERNLLGTIQYEPARAVVHTDPAVMPADRKAWASFNYVGIGPRLPFDQIYYTYYLPQIQPWISNDVFATYDAPEGLIAEDRILKRLRWKHLMLSTEQALAAGEMHRIQGVNRTWFCGEYTSAGYGHDFSFNSGLAIGKALGGEYPFEGRTFARQAFYNHAYYHMKVLRDLPVNQTFNWALPVDAGKIMGGVTRGIMRQEIHKAVAGFLPAGLVRAIADLAALDRRGAIARAEDAVIKVLTRKVSALDEYRKTVGRGG
jgi:predicted NAD/FAD-binding protein